MTTVIAKQVTPVRMEGVYQVDVQATMIAIQEKHVQQMENARKIISASKAKAGLPQPSCIPLLKSMGVRRLFSRGQEPTFSLKNNEKDTIFPKKV